MTKGINRAPRFSQPTPYKVSGEVLFGSQRKTES
jgi:hypothetical protein